MKRTVRRGRGLLKVRWWPMKGILIQGSYTFFHFKILFSPPNTLNISDHNGDLDVYYANNTFKLPFLGSDDPSGSHAFACAYGLLLQHVGQVCIHFSFPLANKALYLGLSAQLSDNRFSPGVEAALSAQLLHIIALKRLGLWYTFRSPKLYFTKRELEL